MDDGSNKTMIIPAAIGHGYNLNSLPGGYSPPSRFVRAYVLKQHALQNLNGPPETYEDGVKLITGVLNNVHITRGSVPNLDPNDDIKKLEFTQWSVIKMPTRREFLYRGYAELAWKRVSLNDIDWNDDSKKVYQSYQVDSGGIDIEEITF